MSYFEEIQAYRARKFRLSPELRVSSLEEAVEFVNERGFVYFWPITGIIFPSLWSAVSGDRPVADEHDDPGHVTWRWKDSLLGGERWYYAKILRKKATMISFGLAPYFYALSENYGSPEEDYLTQYEQGRMIQEAKLVYETLLKEGPMDTISLKRATYLSSKVNQSRFDRALAYLQADFKILPVAVTEAGGWRYAFVYGIVANHYPAIPEQARTIREDQARCKLVETYFQSMGAARENDVRKLFQWEKKETGGAIESLVHQQLLSGPVSFEKLPGEWFVLKELSPNI